MQFTFKITKINNNNKPKPQPLTPKAKRVQRKMSQGDDLLYTRRFGLIKACGLNTVYTDLYTCVERTGHRSARTERSELVRYCHWDRKRKADGYEVTGSARGDMSSLRGQQVQFARFSCHNILCLKRDLCSYKTDFKSKGGRIF